MKIVVLDGETINPGDNPWDPIAQFGELKIHPNTTESEIVENAKDFEIVITNKIPFTDQTLSQLPKLQFIAVSATGYDIVDVDAARGKGIKVANVPAYSTDSVAQHVFAMLLSYIHRPELHHQLIHNGQWQASGNFSFWQSPLYELAGKSIGIVGFGRIGRRTAELANAFGMKISANTRTEKDPPSYEGFSWKTQEAIFAESDVISLHCPQTADNIGFVNSQLLCKMKPTSILINTARGGLVNEPELATALNEGRLVAALLDVATHEPINNDSPLLKAKNCILTPHIGWATLEARRRAMEVTASNVRGFLSGEYQNLV